MVKFFFILSPHMFSESYSCSKAIRKKWNSTHLIHSPKKTLKLWIINENDSRDFQHNFHRPRRCDYIDFQKHILSFRRRKSSTAQNSTRVRVQFLYSIASDVFRNYSCSKTNRKKWNSTYFKSLIPFVQNNIEMMNH